MRVPAVTNFLDYLTAFMETWPAYLMPPPVLRALKAFELSIPERYGVDGVLTVSDTLADLFAGAGFPKEKILPIYYGYDADLFPFREAALARHGAEPPVIVMHGSLDHHHLRNIAVEAVDYVTRRMPQAVFKFVGHRTAALEWFLEQVKKRSPGARVQNTGFVPYAEVSAHLSSATVGMVPYEESTGTHCAFVAKIVEYLAVGLPVVSTPLRSAQRYFGGERMVRFSRFDGESFGQEILRWLEQPQGAWRDDARAISDRVRRELDWRAISRKAVDFVERIPQSSPR